MVILGDDKHGIDADTRYLLFTTQSLVKKTKHTKSVERTSEQSSYSNPSQQKSTKNKSDIKQERTVYGDHEWVMETQLHKRKLKKDIDYTRHL